jgi:hypothetical protein
MLCAAGNISFRPTIRDRKVLSAFTSRFANGLGAYWILAGMLPADSASVLLVKPRSVALRSSQTCNWKLPLVFRGPGCRDPFCPWGPAWKGLSLRASFRTQIPLDAGNEIEINEFQFENKAGIKLFILWTLIHFRRIITNMKFP